MKNSNKYLVEDNFKNEFTWGDCILCAKILQAVTEPSLFPFPLVLLTKSQNCLMVFTSSNLFEGLVALNRSVSKVAAWLMFDLDGEFTGDAVGGDDTTNI